MSTGTGNERERGREAEVPLGIPRAGWREVLVRLKDAIRGDRITLIAAGVAFYAMLALFPAMIVVVSIYGLVMDPEEIAAQVRTLGVLPGDVRSILTGQLDTLARAPSGPAQPEPGLRGAGCPVERLGRDAGAGDRRERRLLGD